MKLPTMISTPALPQADVSPPTLVVATSAVDVSIPASSSSPVSSSRTEEGKPGRAEAVGGLKTTIVFDNNPYDRRLTTAWGFSALIEHYGHTLLFDTGGDGQILLQNMRTLGIDPVQLESVTLSHAHGDHTGGLEAVLGIGVQPTVYLLPSFSDSYKRQIEQKTIMVEVVPWQQLAEGVFTTGEMGHRIPEQSLVVHTKRGLVIITGCAHPGIVGIVKKVQEQFNEPIYLVMGGFHLGSKSKTEINAILTDFRHLGVERVAPCHCTGEAALIMFEAEYEQDFIQAGAGRVIRVGVGDP